MEIRTPGDKSGGPSITIDLDDAPTAVVIAPLPPEVRDQIRRNVSADLKKMGVGAALVTMQISLLMKRLGRKAGFVLGVVLGIVGALICGAAAWINNFWLKNDKDQDLNGVPYRVQLKSRSGKTLVYHDGVSVKAYNGAVTQLGDGRIEIELSIGDPAAGWGGSG